MKYIINPAFIIIIIVLMFSLSYAACPPLLKIKSSIPPDGAKDADISSPIIIEWDKTEFNLPSGLFDYKPKLESINIAGGRYGIGTLLTTEWGIGGKVAWEGKKEIITPEAPLEPGTQYRIWTYVYTSGDEMCPPYGGEIIFITKGKPPDDNNPIRNFDLSTLYHGDKMGSGSIEGEIVSINSELGVITVKRRFSQHVNIILHDGIIIMRNGNFLPPSELKTGDRIEGKFMGGRLYMINLKE